MSTLAEALRKNRALLRSDAQLNVTVNEIATSAGRRARASRLPRRSEGARRAERMA